MALTPKRYVEIDAHLQQLQTYLVSLAGEIGQATPLTDNSCQPCQAASKAADKVADLRYLLAVAEARRQIREDQAHPVPFSSQAMKISGATTRSTSVRTSLPAFKWLTELWG